MTEPEEAPETPVEESEEATEPEETESEPEQAESDAPAEPELELADDARVKVGDKTLTGAEIKAGFMRQADYTRKTQELAAQRKANQVELTKAQEENGEYKEWLGSLKDPQTLKMELLRYYPDTYDQLREAIIRERLEEQELSESEQKLRRKLERADAQEYARKKDQEYQAKRLEHTETQTRVQELRTQFESWLGDCMAPAGLDPANQEHQTLVRNEIAARYRGIKWTEDHFKQAAARIAKALGKAPAEAKKAAAAKALPAIKPQGLKAPAMAKPKAKPKKEQGDFFSRLRSAHGSF